MALERVPKHRLAGALGTGVELRRQLPYKNVAKYVMQAMKKHFEIFSNYSVQSNESINSNKRYKVKVIGLTRRDGPIARA